MDNMWLFFFIIIPIIAVIFFIDFNIINKKNKNRAVVNIKYHLYKVASWVCISLFIFFFYLFFFSHKIAFAYLSVYFTEWSLNVDNMLVFVILFNKFTLPAQDENMALNRGIIFTIISRIIFILLGVMIIQKIAWIMHIFGMILIYSGYKSLFATKQKDNNILHNKFYIFLTRVLPITQHYQQGKMIIKENKKRYVSSLFVLIVLIVIADILFSLDSIPAIIDITQVVSVLILSNICALMGLKNLFFVIRKYVGTFIFLPKGMGILLLFIGLKMEFAHYINLYISQDVLLILSLLVVFFSVFFSIVLSLYWQKRKTNGH